MIFSANLFFVGFECFKIIFYVFSIFGNEALAEKRRRMTKARTARWRSRHFPGTLNSINQENRIRRSQIAREYQQSTLVVAKGELNIKKTQFWLFTSNVSVLSGSSFCSN